MLLYVAISIDIGVMKILDNIHTSHVSILRCSRFIAYRPGPSGRKVHIGRRTLIGGAMPEIIKVVFPRLWQTLRFVWQWPGHHKHSVERGTATKHP
jgi:hypothetical protein